MHSWLFLTDVRQFLLSRPYNCGTAALGMTGSAAHLGGSPGPVFVFRQRGMLVRQTKPFKTYSEQIELLRRRGMIISDAEKLRSTLNNGTTTVYRVTGIRCVFSPAVMIRMPNH